MRACALQPLLKNTGLIVFGFRIFRLFGFRFEGLEGFTI